MTWPGHGLEKLTPKTVRGPLLYVTVATFTNSFVNFGVQIAAARALGVREFGVLSLAFSVTLLTGAIGELGLNLTTIRLFNKHSGDSKAQEILLGSVLAVKATIFVSLLIVSVPIGHLLARGLSGDDENWLLFAVALATGGLLFFWTYLQSLFQCYRQFNRLAAYTMLYSGLRLVALLAAYTLQGEGSLTWLLATYTLPTAILLGVGLIPMAGKLLALSILAPQSSIAALKEAVAYSKWVALSGIAYIAMPYLARFILAVRASVEEVGIFSAGMTFTVAFSTLNTAVRAVIFPQVTALEGRGEIRRYLGRLARIAPYYTVLAVLGIACLGSLQWAVLGEEYRAALPVFLVTAGAFAAVVFLGLGTMLVHTMMRPQVDAWVNVVRLGLMVLLASILVPSFHALGAAAAYAVPVLAGEVWMFWYVSKAGVSR
jgi:O-antigen/teichoic acid export membrane protein